MAEEPLVLGVEQLAHRGDRIVGRDRSADVDRDREGLGRVAHVGQVDEVGPLHLAREGLAIEPGLAVLLQLGEAAGDDCGVRRGPADRPDAVMDKVGDEASVGAEHGRDAGHDDAPNADLAHAFINYVNRPEVMAKIATFVSYASGNLAARPLVAPAVRDNPSIYPPDAVMARLFTVTSPDARLQRVITRAWTRAKTGR